MGAKLEDCRSESSQHAETQKQDLKYYIVVGICIVLALLCGGSIGPLFLSVDIAHPILRASWRQQLASIFFLPLILF